MPLRSFNILVILFLLNASAGMLEASGWTEDAGVDIDPGADHELEKVNKTSQNVSTGAALGGTLFGMLVSAGKALASMGRLVFIAPIMFNNLGVPTWLTAGVFGPMYLIVGIDMLHLVSGRIYA